MEIKRGDVYIAELTGTIGSEQGGRRPVLIIQNDIGNKYSPLVIVAAVTKGNKPDMPTHVVLNHEKGVDDRSIVLLEQIRTIDKGRLHKRIGYLKEETMIKIDESLRYSIGLAGTYPIEICLCPYCRSQFAQNPEYRIWRVDHSQMVKENCTYCGVRNGYDYFVMRVI